MGKERKNRRKNEKERRKGKRREGRKGNGKGRHPPPTILVRSMPMSRSVGFC